MTDMIFSTSGWRVGTRADGFWYAYKGSSERARLGADGSFSFGGDNITIDEEYLFQSQWGAATFVKHIESLERDLAKIRMGFDGFTVTSTPGLKIYAQPTPIGWWIVPGGTPAGHIKFATYRPVRWFARKMMKLVFDWEWSKETTTTLKG